MTRTPPQDITSIGLVGTGVMGSMLCLLLAEYAGIDVYIYDRSNANMQTAVGKAIEAGLEDKIHPCKDVPDLCSRLGPQKVFMFSLPHGSPGDAVVRSLEPHLRKGDIVIDASNENYKVTEKRQGWLQSRAVSYVGMGVSGGFNGARHGPSLMPSGEEQALNRLMPVLEKIAAKDAEGRPCVTKVGSGGSGHYVKTIHNGIEHGIMGVLCEVWALMDRGLGMNGDEIGQVFEDWNSKGELRDNYLVAISGPMCRTKDGNNAYLIHEICDAVVQDANDSEGTGTWSSMEAIAAHVPAPSLTAAHYLRIASANIEQRYAIHETFGPSRLQQLDILGQERSSFLKDLHQAAYAAILVCFIQGLDLLAKQSQRKGWEVDLQEVLRIWRAGCIIKSDYITELLERHYAQSPDQHPMLGQEICADLRRCQPSLKSVVIQGLEADAHLSTLNASLDYLKYVGCMDLPTNFMEAQLDAFGAHGYEVKGQHNDNMSKGKHHNNWNQ